MRVFGIGPAVWALASVLCATGAAGARAATVLSCQLVLDDGAQADPPTTLIVRVAPDEYTDFKDGAWGRNLCGAHGGGEAPDVVCQIHQGYFRADWTWRSNIGKLERHVLLNLSTGELTDTDHNGLEKKGLCKPAPEPVVKPAPEPEPPAKPASAPEPAVKPAPHP